MSKSSASKPQSINFEFPQEATFSVMRSLGYGLLLLAFLDWVEIFTPPNFMNPTWEFQTIGAYVERVPVPLIGLTMIFYGEFQSRNKWELPILKFLSWLSLLLAILFFLMIPLGIANTVRLNKQSAAQINTASQEQISRVEQIAQKLNEATPEKIETILKRQGAASESKNMQQVKEELLSKVTQAKTQIKNQAKTTQSNQGFNLMKTSVKWNLGALIAAALFLSIWKGTQWVRNL